MYLSWLLRGVAAEASCDPGPVGVALMSGNVLQLAANGFLFDLYLDPAQNFSGKAFALTSDGSGDYFIALSQTIISAGTAFISAGQSSSGIDVVSGGTLVVLSGGTALETTVGGGLEIVSSGGIDSGAQIFGGEQDVFGIAGGGTVFGGSQVIEGGGTASNTTIANGGTLVVSAGGLADPTTILGGGLEIISARGSDRGALLSGGEQDVYGNAGGATIFADSQVIESGAARATPLLRAAARSMCSVAVRPIRRGFRPGVRRPSAPALRTPGHGFRAARSWSTGLRAGR
jgi:autotransporter passenger strand-loop-strand repeat protein